MKKQLLTALCLSVGLFSYAQFTTGTVSLTGSTRTVKIDTDATTVTMTLTGDSTHWLGIGFNGTTMANQCVLFPVKVIVTVVASVSILIVLVEPVRETVPVVNWA